ncbi:MAG: hypothetical protein R6U85_06565 [Salinivirgaceae bacterium]
MGNTQRGKKKKNAPSKESSKHEESEIERKILLQLDQNREINKALSKLLHRFSETNKNEKKED